MLILFVVGMCIYTTIEVWFRGYSYRLMSIVGGVALVLLSGLNSEFDNDMPLLTQMFVGGLMITCLELISGEFALQFFGIRMWNYSGQWMSMCDDLICPLFSFFWCLLAGVGIILADTIDFYVLHNDWHPYYRRLNGNIWFYLPERICGGCDNHADLKEDLPLR